MIVEIEICLQSIRHVIGIGVTPGKGPGKNEKAWKLVSELMRSLWARKEVSWLLPLDRHWKFFFHFRHLSRKTDDGLYNRIQSLGSLFPSPPAVLNVVWL